MIKRNLENEIKVVNQLMADLNLLSVLTNEEEVGKFTLQAIKNIPDIDNCCICIRGIEKVIGDSSQDAEGIIDLMKSTPTHIEDINLPPAINKELEIIKLQTPDRKYGYLLFSIKSNSTLEWVKPVISNFINIVAIDLERRFQKKEIEIYHNTLELKIEKRTAEFNTKLISKIKSEKKLKTFKNLLAKAQEIGKLGSWSLNLSSNHLVWSDEIYRIFGLEPQEFAPSYEAFLDAIHPEDRKKVNDAYTDSINKGKNSYEIKHRVINKKTGETHFVKEKCKHEKDASGKIISSTGIIYDITDQILKKEELKESEKKFKAFTSQAIDGITVADLEGNYTYVNPAFCKMSGYTETELLKMTVFDMKAKNQSHKSFYENKGDMEGIPILVNLEKKNGTEYLTEIIGSAITIGKEKLVLGTIRDITERVEADKLLKESEKKFKDLFEKSNDALLIIKNNHFIDCNNATIKMLGYKSKKDIFNIHPSKLSPKLQPDGESSLTKAEAMMHIAFENDSHFFEWNHIRKNGEVFPVEVLLTTITNKPNNKVIYCVWRDITARKNIENNLSKSEEHFRNLFENSPIPLWEEDFSGVKKYIDALKKRGIKDFRKYFDSKPEKLKECAQLVKILNVNQQVLKLYEAESKEELANNIQQIFTEKAFTVFKEKLIIIAEGRKKIVLESEIKTLKGTIKQIRMEWILDKDIKTNLDIVLVSTIDITEKKKNETNLLSLKNQYRTLIDSLPQYIYHLDKNLRFISANNAYCNAYSITEKEIIGKTSSHVFSKEDSKEFMKSDRQIIESGKTVEFEEKSNNLGKNIDWVNVIKIPVKDVKGNTTGMLGIFWDITATKKAEDDLKINLTHLDNAQKIARLGYSERNLNTGEGYWSDGLFKILGVTPKKKDQTTNKLINRIHPDHKPLFKQKHQEIINSEGIIDIELKYFAKNNDLGWIHVISENKKNHQGDLVQHTIYQDITERKQTELLLKENSDLLTNLSAQVPGVIYQFLLRPDGTSCFPYASKGIKDIYGVTPKQVKQNAELVFKAIHPDDLERVSKGIQESAENMSPWRDEYRVILSDKKSPSWVEEYSIPKRLEDGSTLWHGFITNIDQRKKNERKLEEALNITQLGSFVFDDSTGLFETSKICDKIVGIDKSYKRDLQGWIDMMHPDDYNLVKLFTDAIESRSKSFEFRIISPKDKNIVWVLIHIKKEYDNSSVRTKITGTIQDITKRVKGEQALKTSEDRWQFAIDGSGLGLWDWNIETGDTFYSTNWKSMLGYKNDEIENRNEEWEKRVHPGDKESIAKTMQLHYDGKTKHFSIEYRLLCKDNTYKWILDRGKIISYDKDGKPSRMIGTHTDISVAKASIKKIEKYSNLVKESLNEIYLFDTETYKFLDANKSGLKNLGYTLEEIQELTPLDIAPEFDHISFKKLIKPLIDKKEDRSTFYTSHLRKDGTLYPIEIYLQLTSHEDQDYYSAFVIDITDRKKAEQELIKSEKQLGIMFNYAPLGIALVDSLSGYIHKSNLEFSKIISRSKKEISHIDWMSITHPDDLQEDLDNMHLLNLGKITGFKMDKRYIKPNGDIVWVNMTIAPLSLEDKTQPQHLCMIEDITERKIAEIDFLNSQQHLKNAQDIAQLGYFETNLKTEKTIWSKGMYQVIGHSKDEITPCINSFNDFIHPDDFEILNKSHQNMINSRKKIQDEYRIIDKSGKLKWMVTSRQCKEDENGELIIKGVVQDITIRKEAELSIINEKELFKAIINNIPVMISLYNPMDEMLTLNREFEKTIGWSTEDVQIIDLMEKVYPEPEYRKKVTDYMNNTSNEWKGFKVKTKSEEFIDSEWSNIKLDNGTQIGIGIDITERKKTQEKLIKYQEELEDLVAERTKEITDKNTELDKAMKVFVGRELTIRNLQKRIIQLEKKQE